MTKLRKHLEAELKSLERIWREFPWLWKIHSTWRINLDMVTVENAQDSILGSPADEDHRCRYWAAVTHADGLTFSVVPLSPTAYVFETLAEATLRSFRVGYRVSHIVRKEISDMYGEDRPVAIIKILRPKKGADLHEMCLKIAPHVHPQE